MSTRECTINSRAVAHAQNHRSCLGLIETCYSGPEVAVLQANTTDEGLNQ